MFCLCLFVFCVFPGSIFSATIDEGDISYQKLKIEDGYIRGTIQELLGSNKSVYAFRGIPYAKPPLGDLRFEPPERNDKWNDVLDARYDKQPCVQALNPVEGSEDCLHINVYTPKLQGNLSVMVWIYGGAFIRGKASYDYYRPDPLLQEDVIVVSFNYRVGVFGFLSTGDTVVPGNTGLKDQCFALKWVQRNIKYFGGDPKKVTIFGESAGAASVSYQLQSKCATGLYRAAIMQSGNSLCLWALTRKPRYIAFETGLGLKVDTTNSTTLVKDLKKIPYKDLQVVSLVTGVGAILPNPLAGLMFAPVIEPPHENSFFSSYSNQILSDGHFNKVPVIIGVNSNEAAVIHDLPALIRIYFVRYDVDYRALAPADLTYDTIQHDSAGFAIRLHYFGLSSIAANQENVIRFISDDQFNRPTRQTVLNMAKYVPVYFYRFSYKGRLGNGASEFQDVGHGEDLGYFFSSSNETSTSSDQLTRSRLVKLWTNFAKHKDPTPYEDPLLQNIKWKDVRQYPKPLALLEINRDLNISHTFVKDLKFYDLVYKNHGSPPYNTY